MPVSDIVAALRARSNDTSASGRLRILKAQTLATYHANNEPLNDYGGTAQPSSNETRILREVGTNQLNGTCDYCNTCLTVCDIGESLGLPMNNNPDDETSYWEVIQESLNMLTPPLTIPPPPIGFPTDGSNYGWIFFITPVCNATSYQITWTDDAGPIAANITNLGTAFVPIASESFIFFSAWPLRTWDLYTNTLSMTASNECSTKTSILEYGCFLEGAPVSMADGSTKPIETVTVGDKVIGAFGETNTVLALHQPKLGAGSVVVINNEHTTTAHHPHIGVDHAFYCVKPDILSGLTYGRKHTVTLADGTQQKRIMPGVNKDRLAKLEIGVALQTLTGSRMVNTIEYKTMSPFTQVYHLVVDGSHTFNVECYAVTGWATDSDFNYDTWTPK